MPPLPGVGTSTSGASVSSFHGAGRGPSRPSRGSRRSRTPAQRTTASSPVSASTMNSSDAAPADRARVRLDDREVEAAALEDPAVRRVLRLVGAVEPLGVRVEGVAVVHQELAAAHQAEARTDLVAELRPDLVERHRQLPVRGHARSAPSSSRPPRPSARGSTRRPCGPRGGRGAPPSRSAPSGR